MTPEQLKASILKYAMQGKLVEQRAEEGTAEELYQRMQTDKQNRKSALIAESRTTERRYIRFIIRTRLMMQQNLRNSLCSVK